MTDIDSLFVDPMDREVRHPLLGNEVWVRLDNDGDKWIHGTLLRLTESGDVDVLEADGRTCYAWPALEIVESRPPA
jgi:hypothetical protein